MRAGQALRKEAPDPARQSCRADRAARFQVNVHSCRSRSTVSIAGTDRKRPASSCQGEDGEYSRKQPGDKLIQPDLARTLHAIGERGPDAFYRGRVARSIVGQPRLPGGSSALDDWRASSPSGSTRIDVPGHRISPCPCLERRVHSLGCSTCSSASSRRAGATGRSVPARDDRDGKAPVRRASEARRPRLQPGVEDRVSADDRQGLAGDLWRQIGEQATPPLSWWCIRSTGPPRFPIDEEGTGRAQHHRERRIRGLHRRKGGRGPPHDEWTTSRSARSAQRVRRDGRRGDAPGPGRCAVSMAPTFVFGPDGDSCWRSARRAGVDSDFGGAAIVHLVDDGMAVDRAIGHSRFHHNLFPDVVRVEPSGLEAATVRALEQRGHKLQFGASPSRSMARVSSIPVKGLRGQVNPDTRWRMAPAILQRRGRRDS